MTGITSFLMGVLGLWGGSMRFMGRTRGTNARIIRTRRRTALDVIVTIVLGWMLNNLPQKGTILEQDEDTGKEKIGNKLEGKGSCIIAWEYA